MTEKREGYWPPLSVGDTEAEAATSSPAVLDVLTCKRCGHHEGCASRCCMNQAEPCNFRREERAASPPALDPRDRKCLTLGCTNVAGPWGGRCEKHHRAASPPALDVLRSLDEWGKDAIGQTSIPVDKEGLDRLMEIVKSARTALVAGSIPPDVKRLAEAVLEYDEWDEGGGCRYCTETPHATDCVTHIASRLTEQETS